MIAWELAVAAVLYLNVARRYFATDDLGMALAFFSYALANVGFIWAALK